MKKTVFVIVALMIFSSCSPRTNTSQSPETSSEPIQSSSMVSSENSSGSSDMNTGSNASNPPESQSSDSPSSESSSAAPAQTVIEPDATSVYIELSSNTITLSQMNSSFQVAYKIYNNSSREIHSSPNYVIEKQTGADWIPFPFDELEQPNWPTVVYSLPAGGTFDENMSYWAFEEDMTPGTYRLVKYAGEEGKDWLPLYAKFSVTE